MNSVLKVRGTLKVQGSLNVKYVFPDLVNWLDILNINNLPLPSDKVILALNNLLVTIYQQNLRSKIKRLNLFCAGDWRGSFFPIISDVGNDWDYNGIHGSTVADLANGPIQSGDWTITTGYNFVSNSAYWPDANPGVNGLLQYNYLKLIDTTFPENDASIANNSAHVSCYISGINNTSPITTYCTDLGGDATYFDLQCAYNGNSNDSLNIVRYNCYTQNSTDTAGGYLATSFNPLGFYIGSRVSTTLNTMYKNGYYQNLPVTGGSNPNTSTMVSTAPTSVSSILLGGKTNGTDVTPGSNRTVNNVTDRTYSMYSIGSGLTDTEALIFNNAIVVFNNAIGRTNY